MTHGTTNKPLSKGQKVKKTPTKKRNVVKRTTQSKRKIDQVNSDANSDANVFLNFVETTSKKRKTDE